MVAGFMLETHPHKVIARNVAQISFKVQSLFDVRHRAVVWIFLYLFQPQEMSVPSETGWWFGTFF
jgi:hypothetical protein